LEVFETLRFFAPEEDRVDVNHFGRPQVIPLQLEEARGEEGWSMCALGEWT
jgi:hypothetical protein